MTPPLQPEQDPAAYWRAVARKTRAALRADPSDREAAQWSAIARERLLSISSARAEERVRANEADTREARAQSTLGSFGLGFSRGATFGFGDELAGLVAGAGALVPGGQSPAEAYRSQRDETRLATQGAEESHPVATVLGDVAGTVATAAPIVKGGSLLVRGASAGVPRLIARSAIGAAEGAVLSGAHAAGRSDETPEQRLRATRDAALVGAILGGVAPVAGAIGAETASPATRFLTRIGRRLLGTTEGAAAVPTLPTNYLRY